MDHQRKVTPALSQGLGFRRVHVEREFLNSCSAGLLHRAPRFPQEPGCGKGGGGQGQERKRISRLNFCHLMPDVSSFSAVSIGPFPVLVSSKLPKNANLFLLVSIICRQQASSRCPRSSVLWSLPPSPDPSPKPPHFQVSAPAEAPGSQHPSSAFLPSCSSWWFKTSLPSV